MSLSNDEHVIYSTRLSKRIFVKPFMVSVVALVLAFISGALPQNTPITRLGIYRRGRPSWCHRSPSIYCPSSR